MLFHSAKDFNLITSMYKRAERFGKDLKLTTEEISNHPKGIAWLNVKECFLDYYKDNPSIENYQDTIHLLDWYAGKVDKYLEGNLLENDLVLHHILYEWKSYCFFDPTKLKSKEYELHYSW